MHIAKCIASCLHWRNITSSGMRQWDAWMLSWSFLPSETRWASRIWGEKTDLWQMEVACSKCWLIIFATLRLKPRCLWDHPHEIWWHDGISEPFALLLGRSALCVDTVLCVGWAALPRHVTVFSIDLKASKLHKASVRKYIFISYLVLQYTCPNLGWLIALLAVSPKHNWKDINIAVLLELLDRSVIWACKGNKDLVNCYKKPESAGGEFLHCFVDYACSRQYVYAHGHIIARQKILCLFSFQGKHNSFLQVREMQVREMKSKRPNMILRQAKLLFEASMPASNIAPHTGKTGACRRQGLRVHYDSLGQPAFSHKLVDLLMTHIRAIHFLKNVGEDKQLLDGVFESTRVSRGLIAFHSAFMREVARPYNVSLEAVMDQSDSMFGFASETQSRRIQQVVRRSQQISSWADFFKLIGAQPNTGIQNLEAFMTGQLRRSWENSLSKKYHTKVYMSMDSLKKM